MFHDETEFKSVCVHIIIVMNYFVCQLEIKIITVISNITRLENTFSLYHQSCPNFAHFNESSLRLT